MLDYAEAVFFADWQRDSETRERKREEGSERAGWVCQIFKINPKKSGELLEELDSYVFRDCSREQGYIITKDRPGHGLPQILYNMHSEVYCA